MHILIFGKKNKNFCDFDLIKFLQISIFGTKPLLTILQKSSEFSTCIFGLYVSLVLTLGLTAVTFSFPCHPCDTQAHEKKVRSYAFLPCVYQEKSLPCG